MAGIDRVITKKGFYPLACDVRGAIAWRGEYLRDFWMWNGLFTEYRAGIKYIQTVKVTDLKEAAIRYWRDGWIPLKPVDRELLSRMEDTLRNHSGLRSEGVSFPDTPFLKPYDPIPEEFFSPEVREYMGLKKVKAKKLIPRLKINKRTIEAYKKTKEGLNGKVVF
ncbi:MAG: hypothetical protein ACE5EB_01885 [Thermodesulfobacteriota bacterium]